VNSWRDPHPRPRVTSVSRVDANVCPIWKGRRGLACGYVFRATGHNISRRVPIKLVLGENCRDEVGARKPLLTALTGGVSWTIFDKDVVADLAVPYTNKRMV
jgi:hypothetical protein